jgi:hypothetical protein
MKEKEKIISHEMPLNESEQHVKEQAIKPDGNHFQKIEAEEMNNIRTEFAAMSADTVATPTVNKEKVLQGKPENKAVKIMKEIWERIKKAGRVLFKPGSKKETSFNANTQYFYMNALHPEQTQKQTELSPLEETFDFIFKIISRIFQAGKAAFKPGDKERASSFPTAYKQKASEPALQSKVG